MTDPIRVLHFADTHIGVESYGRTDPETGLSSRVRDFLRRMDEMIDYVREHGVDLVIFAGDAFKTRSPSPTYQREFAYRMSDLAELAPTVMLVGNHDVPPNYLRASSIEIYDTLNVKNISVASDFEVLVIETKRGKVAVGTAPYPQRSMLLQGVVTTGRTIHEIDLTLQDIMAEQIDRLAEEVDELDMPRLLTGHFTVSGATVGSERQIMLGRDISVSMSSVADPRWDYVALGHIHKHQNLTARREGAPPVVYSGSLERIDFGEEGDNKGFCYVELQRENTTWDFIPSAARPFVTLRADLRESQNPTQYMVDMIKRHNLREAVVRLVLQLTPDTEARLNENALRSTLREAGVFYIAAVSKDVEQVARMRLGSSPEGLTHRELLERYLLSKEVPPERRTVLLEAADAILTPDA
ncbi:MAG: exonuclease SbcCD subunit D [Chloroflexota bacterium]